MNAPDAGHTAPFSYQIVPICFISCLGVGVAKGALFVPPPLGWGRGYESRTVGVYVLVNGVAVLLWRDTHPAAEGTGEVAVL